MINVQRMCVQGNHKPEIIFFPHNNGTTITVAMGPAQRWTGDVYHTDEAKQRRNSKILEKDLADDKVARDALLDQRHAPDTAADNSDSLAIVACRDDTVSLTLPLTPSCL